MIRRFWYILGTGVHVCTMSPAEGRVFPDAVLRAGAMTGKRRKKKSGSGNGAAETVKTLPVIANQSADWCGDPPNYRKTCIFSVENVAVDRGSP